MPLTPQEIKQLCVEYGLNPSKAYGQNYLIQDAPIITMIEAANIGPHDTVIEVGPGFGVLTFALAGKAKEVIAFEIEKTLQPYWSDQAKKYPNVRIIWGNVLTEAYRHPFPTDRPYKVVANVPYQITSDLFRLFFETTPPPECVVAMVQREVADRLTAKAGDMSLLALSAQYYGDVTKVLNVSKGSFWPSPAVDSAVVAIHVRKTNQEEARLFFTLAKAGFSHKRKKLVNNLANGLHISGDIVTAALERSGLRPDVRAESLEVKDWQTLLRDLTPHLSTK